jgi:hypothetical protein
VSRTTIDIDDPILRELKRLQKQKKVPLGRLVSDLLARALGSARTAQAPPALQWTARPMGEARVDLKDKEALWAILDGREPS